ncbi:DUF4340 domain-containing protein [Opitutus terrae]|uniref:DUF4340 domain-containing protein n=1 Tax=Opitutus terrae (strain DSM 11246 / JCM 15787 / PB90-1) TaxID=452637 RepID=B2A0C3_OPITP|nr:DUF4340 domain-containing protein [Opitutus terrae]ACB77459.1 hypothetical protein Oter_4186 [Opitutus terrae PB90-1]
MKLRTLSIVVLVLAALAVLAYVLQRPAAPAAADARVGQPLVGSGAIEKMATLKLSDQGKSVSLVHQPDNSWKVASYYDLPADFSKLSRFISDLTEAKVQRLVTSKPERIARLEFKDTKLELLDAANKPLVSLTLGKNADTGGRYVRYDDETKAYLANLNAWLDAESKNWANSQLIEVKPEDLAKVELTFPDGATVVASRAKKEDAWKAEAAPEGQQLKADRISSLLSSLSNLRFSDTAEPNDPRAQEAKAHQRTVKLTTFDQKTVTIALGRKPEEKKLKPPAPGADGKSGPAALGSVSDLAKKEPATDSAKSDEEKSPTEPKPLAPEYETVPAGPVFVSVSNSDSTAPVNALMAKRAFQISDYVFTGLPQKREDLFEPVPPPAATTAPAAATPDAAKPPAPSSLPEPTKK